MWHEFSDIRYGPLIWTQYVDEKTQLSNSNLDLLTNKFITLFLLLWNLS